MGIKHFENCERRINHSKLFMIFLDSFEMKNEQWENEQEKTPFSFAGQRYLTFFSCFQQLFTKQFFHNGSFLFRNLNIRRIILEIYCGTILITRKSIWKICSSFGFIDIPAKYNEFSRSIPLISYYCSCPNSGWPISNYEVITFIVVWKQSKPQFRTS